MQIIGCDLHARQLTLAMLDTETGEAVNRTLTHEGNNVREFYSALPGPVRVGILHALADRPLVHIQSDVIHRLHGGASLVSLNQRAR
jgi:hypothetical protein